MRDVRVASLAAKQFNRVSRRQLLELGVTEEAIRHRVAAGRLVYVERGVLAVAPVLGHDPWGRWMGATLTHPGTLLSHLSAAVAWEMLGREGWYVTVTRPGSGGPRRHGGLVVHRSSTVAFDRATLNGIPITAAARTLLDLSTFVSDRALARAVREAVRLGRMTLYALTDALHEYRGRRGSRRLAGTVARYSGLPIERARSGAEVRAVEILKEAGDGEVRLNHLVANEEADLSWASKRLVIEIDGAPFHRDIGEDARKERAWKAAGWTIKRLTSEDVYERPERLLALAPPPARVNVPQGCP